MNPEQAFHYGLYALIAMVALIAVCEAWKRLDAYLANRRAVAKAIVEGRAIVIQARWAYNNGWPAVAIVVELHKLMDAYGLSAESFSVGDDIVSDAELNRLAAPPAVVAKATATK